jgi:sugar (pentulose or hexulose) kinase
LSVKVTKPATLQEELKTLQAAAKNVESKLKALQLPPLELSSVYAAGMVYGLVYSDGHGTIEALSIMDNQPERLIERAKKLIKDYLNEKLYVVGFKPESIYAVVEDGKAV